MPIGNYLWSPEQLERVNARRARRGQEPLIQRGSKYAEEYLKRQASDKPKRRFPETDEDETQVAKMGEVETPRLDEYKKGTRRMGAPKTSRLDEYYGRLARRESQRGPMLIHMGGGMAS